jgi:alkylation response protein AidB-like acyl-CoA dehydrogenase
MDLELSNEQTLLSESVETLLTREWVGADRAFAATPADRDRLWRSLVEFGGLSVDREDGLGAVELCLVCRTLGAHLAAVPYLGSAAVRFALEPFARDVVGYLASDRVTVALLEPGGGWSAAGARTELAADGLRGEKVAVEHADDVDRLAVVATVGGDPALALVRPDAAGVGVAAQPAFDAIVPMGAVRLAGAVPCAVADGPAGALVVERLMTVGALLAAAEAVGAAGAVLEEARRYAGERRQFGRTIGSYQALRHLMADMHVRQASSWSTVLYAAAALDEDLPDAPQTAAVAKAYVSRAAREVVHGAMQVFGGIAFTAEHPAHRFLRRVVVREQQFGDAAHHERELGRMLAARATAEAAVASPTPLPAAQLG